MEQNNPQNDCNFHVDKITIRIRRHTGYTLRFIYCQADCISPLVPSVCLCGGKQFGNAIVFKIILWQSVEAVWRLYQTKPKTVSRFFLGMCYTFLNGKLNNWCSQTTFTMHPIQWENREILFLNIVWIEEIVFRKNCILGVHRFVYRLQNKTNAKF